MNQNNESPYKDSPMGIFDDFEGMDSNKMEPAKISNDLIEAYKGYYEDEWSNIDYDSDYKSWDEKASEIAKEKILSHSPKERLEIYCEWNGILGYSNRLFEIATGEL